MPGSCFDNLRAEEPDAFTGPDALVVDLYRNARPGHVAPSSRPRSAAVLSTDAPTPMRTFRPDMAGRAGSTSG